MQGLCITAEVVFPQRILIFKHQIVHSPKLTLGVGRFGGLLSQGMFMSQWEMAKDESQTSSESGLEPFDERNSAFMGLPCPTKRAGIRSHVCGNVTGRSQAASYTPRYPRIDALQRYIRSSTSQWLPLKS